MERTIVMLKPDCISKGFVGAVIERFERKGLKIVGMKMVKLKKKVFDELYAHHKEKEFFERLVRFMRRTPVVAIVLEGENVTEVVRKMCGVTTGREAEPGTVRGDFSMSKRSNIIHAADSPEAAKREIGLLFKPKEIYDYKTLLTPMIYSEEELAEEVRIKRLGRPRKIPGKEGEPRPLKPI